MNTGKNKMNKHDIIQQIAKCGIVGIVRADSGEGLVRVVEAIAEGGIRCVEVTMTTPGALKCIEDASEKLAGSGVLLGVGSVLDAETARLAILAGAQYVVSPITSKEVIDMAHRYGKPALPGAFTPTEIYNAWQLGGDFVKVFPATLGGLDYIKAVRAPMPQIPLVPTGGVNVDNIGDFVKAGISAVGIGNGLARKDLIANQDYQGLTENAKRFKDAFESARG